MRDKILLLISKGLVRCVFFSGELCVLFFLHLSIVTREICQKKNIYINNKINK